MAAITYPAAVLGLAVMLFLCWRMVIGMMAGRPVSERLREAAGLKANRGCDELEPSDFAILESLCLATGALSEARAIGPIRAYYGLARGLGLWVPSLGAWSRREMTVCARYLAARVDRQLRSNILCSHRAQMF